MFPCIACHRWSPHPHGQGSVTPRVQLPGPIPHREHWGSGTTPCPARYWQQGWETERAAPPSTCRDGWGGGRELAADGKEARAGKSGLFPAAVSHLTLDNPVPQFTPVQQPACSGWGWRGGGQPPPGVGDTHTKSPPKPAARSTRARPGLCRGRHPMPLAFLLAQPGYPCREGQTLPAPLGAAGGRNWGGGAARNAALWPQPRCPPLPSPPPPRTQPGVPPARTRTLSPSPKGNFQVLSVPPPLLPERKIHAGPTAHPRRHLLPPKLPDLQPLPSGRSRQKRKKKKIPERLGKMLPSSSSPPRGGGQPGIKQPPARPSLQRRGHGQRSAPLHRRGCNPPPTGAAARRIPGACSPQSPSRYKHRDVLLPAFPGRASPSRCVVPQPGARIPPAAGTPGRDAAGEEGGMLSAPESPADTPTTIPPGHPGGGRPAAPTHLGRAARGRRAHLLPKRPHTKS